MMKRSSSTPSARLVQVRSTNVDIAKAVLLQDEIARRGGLGLKRFGQELVGPCPRCGGRDRFSVSISKRIFHCRGCGKGGDVIELVRHIDQCDFRTAIQTLTGSDRQVEVMHRVRHQGAVDRKTSQEDDADRVGLALRIWREAQPIAGTLAERYLAGRKLHDLPGDDVLRFHHACPFSGERHPALIALFRDITTNVPKAIHRIAIDADGKKIAKKMLGPVAGCAIKLDADENVELGITIGEGLETTLAGRQLGFRSAWALGSSGALKNFPVLAGIEALTVLVDNDAPDRAGREAGQAAAKECGRCWKAAGREVLAFTTDTIGTDIADIIENMGDGNA